MSYTTTNNQTFAKLSTGFFLSPLFGCGCSDLPLTFYNHKSHYLHGVVHSTGSRAHPIEVAQPQNTQPPSSPFPQPIFPSFTKDRLLSFVIPPHQTTARKTTNQETATYGRTNARSQEITREDTQTTHTNMRSYRTKPRFSASH